jgi:hypothetical protein
MEILIVIIGSYSPTPRARFEDGKKTIASRI